MEIVAVDIGNSTIQIGVFSEKDLRVMSMNTLPMKTTIEYRDIIRDFLAENIVEKNTIGVIISSVVPGHTEVFTGALKELFSVEPFQVTAQMNTGLTFPIPDPEGLGADRIANAVAAYERYRCPVAVIDCGTATTISVVGINGEYNGGAILPGLMLMNKSLAEGASRLNEVPLTPPGSALGPDTIRCIQSGLFYGTAGAVERLLREMEKEKGIQLKAVVTGGFGDTISTLLEREHEFIPHLTLEGLKILYMRNVDA